MFTFTADMKYHLLSLSVFLTILDYLVIFHIWTRSLAGRNTVVILKIGKRVNQRWTFIKLH